MHVTLRDAPAMGLMTLVLLIAAVTDLRRGMVPNALTYPAIALGMIWAMIGSVLQAGDPSGESVLSQMASGLGQSLAALLIAALPAWWIFRAGGIGGGDVKLLATVGAVSASIPVVVGTALVGLCLAAGWALIVMIRKRIVTQTLLRIGAAAVNVAARRKPEIDDRNSPRLPLAITLAIGGILAGLEHLMHLPMPWTHWLTP